MPRVPLPDDGITFIRETWTASSEDITPRSSLLRTHAPIPLTLPSFGYSPRSRSLGRLLPAPAANGIFPTLSLQIFPQMPGPLPRRSPRVHLPVSSSESSAFPKTLWVGFPFQSANAILPRASFSRLQTFLYVQASEFARLPDRSYRCEPSRRAAEIFYVRAYRASLPPHVPDMLSARYRQLTEKGLSPFKICSLVGYSSVSLASPTA